MAFKLRILVVLNIVFDATKFGSALGDNGCRPWILTSNQEYANGNCRKARNLDTTCQVRCQRNHVFPGKRKRYRPVRCRWDPDATIAYWDPPVLPRCQEVRCGMKLLPNRNLYNNNSCPAGRSVGASCLVACKPGFRMRRDARTWIAECKFKSSRGVTAEWDLRKLPTCRAITCPRWKLRAHQEYSNHNCLKSRNLNSSCRIRCRNRFVFPGTAKRYRHVHCRLNADLLSASWSPRSIPGCQDIVCEPLPKPRRHISIMSCSAGKVGSSCRVQCKEGYGFSNGEKFGTAVCKLKRQNSVKAEWDLSDRSPCDKLDPCRTKPCMNGGVCSESGASYICECRGGFAGRACNEVITPMTTAPTSRSGIHASNCRGEWTQWFNSDRPDDDGDIEDLNRIRTENPLKACISPSLIDARVVSSRIVWTKAGDIVSLTASERISCLNEDQKDGRKCQDYEVRFCCPVITNRKDVEFVARTFMEMIATVSSSADIRVNTEECDNRYLDSNNKTRMVGKVCPTRRKKRQLEPTEGELLKRDIFFLIDGSESVGAANFRKFLRLTEAIIENFCDEIDVNERKTRVSVMSFDLKQHLQFDFDEYFDKEKLVKGIRDIQYNRSTAAFTCLVESLQFVNAELFTTSYGARPLGADVRRDIILISDGCQNCFGNANATRRLNAVTRNLTREGISVLTFLVGQNTDECVMEMKELIDGSKCYQEFVIKSFDEVDVTVDLIESSMCRKSWNTGDTDECDENQSQG